MESDNLYLVHREALESALSSICRRFRLSPVDAEDFSSDFRLRLVREDYATLRQFQGRSSFRTYLHVVVTRAFQDWRNARWGKWRPSAEARRLGPVAERLERLIVRDGYTIDEAEQLLRTNLGIADSRAALESLAARFPPRQGRRFVADDALEHTATAEAPPDEALERRDTGPAAASAGRALRKAAATLADEDQIILRMRFEDCLSIADISRALRLEQKPLYRRLSRLLTELRRALEAEGITADVAAGILEAGGFREFDAEVRLTSRAVAPTYPRESVQ